MLNSDIYQFSIFPFLRDFAQSKQPESHMKLLLECNFQGSLKLFIFSRFYCNLNCVRNHTIIVVLYCNEKLPSRWMIVLFFFRLVLFEPFKGSYKDLLRYLLILSKQLYEMQNLKVRQRLIMKSHHKSKLLNMSRKQSQQLFEGNGNERGELKQEIFIHFSIWFISRFFIHKIGEEVLLRCAGLFMITGDLLQAPNSFART